MEWNKNKKQKKTLFLISSLRSKMRSGGKISELEKHLGQEKSLEVRAGRNGMDCGSGELLAQE